MFGLLFVSLVVSFWDILILFILVMLHDKFGVVSSFLQGILQIVCCILSYWVWCVKFIYIELELCTNWSWHKNKGYMLLPIKLQVDIMSLAMEVVDIYLPVYE